MIWSFHVLTSYFYLLYYFSPSASPFTFYPCRVLNVHNWAFDFIRFFDPTLLSVSLSLLFKLDFGLAVFFFLYEISGDDGKTEIVYTEQQTWKGVCQEIFAS
jgi:hypothetical protein